LKVAKNISNLVGNTPIIKLNKIDADLPGNIYAKCEFMNPASSVKDRIALNMITHAMFDGTVNKDTHIIEPTSGNTGVGLASQCASMGLKLTLVMPDSMSLERRQLMGAFGANLVLTPASEGMKGSVAKAQELCKSEENAIILNQFSNPTNPLVHEKTTAIEILDAMGKEIDIFVAAVGTGGTLSGTGKILKQEIENIEIVAVEPKDSSVLSGGKPGPHKIQGIGAGFVPDTLNTAIYEQIVQIENEEAIARARELARKEGILVGISSGANVEAAIKLASLEENKDKNILTVLCDSGERYLSTGIFS
jgi:cysteine synthase A